MPNITQSGTYTKNTANCADLEYRGKTRTLLFAGTSLGTTCVIQYTDDSGTDRTIAGGTITTLPTSVEVKAPVDLKVVVTGSPNFNVTILRE